MSISRNFDYLPANVLTLSGYDFCETRYKRSVEVFFQFIKITLGEPEANLLNKISVKTTSGFLLIDDPREILKYDIEDEELEKLKDELTFKLKNQKFLIKPGIISGFRSLKDALEKRLNEQLKKSKRKQQHQQQLSNFYSSTMSSLTTTAPTTAQVTTVSNTLSLSDHKAYVLEFIRKWCSDNKENFNLENFNLEEDVDFQLNIHLDENFDVKARIKCKCNKLISLGKNDNKIQVSNYYKHLHSNGCDHMKNIKKAAKDLRSIQQQSSTPGTLTSSSQSYVPLLQVPAVPLTTTQSASHSDSPALSNRSTHNRKRRLPSQSQSQQHQPAKRSRM